MVRLALVLFFLLSLNSIALAGPWEGYKKRFVTPDGRTIDYSQNQVSHSEGQGAGMLLSVAYDDKKAFDALWRWTKDNLSKRQDALLAWQWGKRPNGEWGVIDYNNALDGDILVAYALLRAHRLWGDPSYKHGAIAIIADIRKHLVVSIGTRTFLLPSYYGFTQEKAVVLNPSYYILPAFRLFAEADDAKFWQKIYADSLHLMRDVCFGSMCLPADWVIFSGDSTARLYSQKSPLYGHEAVRTVMHMALSNERMSAGVIRLLDFYRKNGYMPMWVDLERNSVSLDRAKAGYYAVYALAAKALKDDVLAGKLEKEAKTLLDEAGDDYYSYSLFLLSFAQEK